jgi:hypothetical protein
MAKISELQLVQPNEALDENGLIPVVVNTENGKKINKVIQTQKLADEIIEFTSGEDGKLTQVLGEYTTKNELNEQLTQINSAIELKANADHNHGALYSEKTHTHNYVDLKGLPNIANISPQDYADLLNHVDQIDNEVYTCITNTDMVMEAFSEMNLMGEWTPVAYVGNDVLASTESIGTYYCTGNLCFINGTITFISGENMSQHLKIGALPFAPDHACHCIPLGMYTGLVLDPQYKQVNARLTENGYIELYQMVQSEWFPVSGTCVSQEGATISFSGTYIIRSI